MEHWVAFPRLYSRFLLPIWYIVVYICQSQSPNSFYPPSLLGIHKFVLYMNGCVLSRFSHVWLCVTLRAVTCQAPLSMGFSRQECWNELPCPLPGDLPNPGIKPCLSCFPYWHAGCLPVVPLGTPILYICLYFCFANIFSYTIFLDSTHKQYYTTFVFLFLTYCTLRTVSSQSMSLPMTQFHSFLWLSNIPLHVYTTSSLSFPLLMEIWVASMPWLL